jgi:1,4-dihydroxy-2-naphthoate octaprenyltransferase
VTRLLLRLARPVHLVLLGLTYLLGAGMARYLGHTPAAPAFWLGLVCILLLGAASSWIMEYFRPAEQPIFEDETPVRRLALRRTLFWAFVIALIVSAALLVPLALQGSLTMPALIVLTVGWLLALAYGLPPVRLTDRGLGELTRALLLADVTPAAGFLLQTDELHRLLPMLIFPLTFLALACLIALDFPSYATDQKYGCKTLALQMGWQRAVWLHHLLAAGAYLLFACGPLFGFPFSLLWPAFLSLPLAVLQIVWLNRIAEGNPPVWPFVTALAAGVIGLSAYSLALTFWIR